MASHLGGEVGSGARWHLLLFGPTLPVRQCLSRQRGVARSTCDAGPASSCGHSGGNEMSTVRHKLPHYAGKSPHMSQNSN